MSDKAKSVKLEIEPTGHEPINLECDGFVGLALSEEDGRDKIYCILSGLLSVRDLEKLKIKILDTLIPAVDSKIEEYSNLSEAIRLMDKEKRGEDCYGCD